MYLAYACDDVHLSISKLDVAAGVHHAAGPVNAMERSHAVPGNRLV
jgi:hypothetical protein